jgi:outer membrane lipoprotein-sorting protein
MYDFARFLVILHTLTAIACTSTQLKAEEPKESQVVKEAIEPIANQPSVGKKKVDLSLTAIEKFYSKTSGLEMKVTKTLHLKMLDQKKQFIGKMTIRRPGNLKIEFDEPEKSVAIVTPKGFILAQYPTDDMDKTVRITRSRDSKRIQSQYLVAALMGRGSILKHFKISKETRMKNETGVLYQLAPKDNDSDIKFVELQIYEEGERGLIRQISYTDKLDNVTELKFENIKVGVKVDLSTFSMKIPKNAEVTEI